MKLVELDLTSLGGGVALELFQRELEAVLEDIGDPNTQATAVRKIVIEVAIQPAESRESAAVAVRTTRKLAGLIPAGTVIHLGRRGAQMKAYTSNPDQLNIPTAPEGIVERS